MIEAVAFKEVMPALEERLSRRLRKVRVFPELIQHALPAARRLSVFKTLQKVGAELFLASPIDLNRANWDKPIRKFNWAHPIPEEKRKLFAICRKLGFDHHFAYDREIYIGTETLYMGKMVLVYLGGWKPYVELTSDPLEMSAGEFLRVCEEVQRYRVRMKKYAENFRVNMERFMDGRPVFLSRGNTPDECRFVADVRYYTEYSDAYVAITEWDRLREEEEEKRAREKFGEEVRRLEGLINRGKRVKEEGCHIIFEVSPEDVENTLKVPVMKVAERIFTIRSTYPIYDNTNMSISTPVNYLHALRYLRDAGVEATLVRCGWAELGRRLAIQIYGRRLAENYYNIIIIPKRVFQLPPIPLSNVIRSQKRIVVVGS